MLILSLIRPGRQFDWAPMARRLRLQFPGAIYHVINRGNYRRDIFESVGAAKAFQDTLDEACERHQWRLHAYVLMRNHFHLAVETPLPNLIDGMHWLQSTYSTRFNRFRSESGHLFQGRYQSLLLENVAVLTRVVNYIHLNPVRAKIVEPQQVAAFRWSSLSRFLRSERPQHLIAVDWLRDLRLFDSADGWRDYVALLVETSTPSDTKRDHEELCTGWAIGTEGWRKAVAKDHVHLALHRGVAADELRDVKHARWNELLLRLLEEHGKSIDLARTEPKGVVWKCMIAEKLRTEAAAPHGWIARNLFMGSENSVRSYVSRRRNSQNQQLSA